jgi:hypothetical protein
MVVQLCNKSISQSSTRIFPVVSIILQFPILYEDFVGFSPIILTLSKIQLQLVFRKSLLESSRSLGINNRPLIRQLADREHNLVWESIELGSQYGRSLIE